MKDCASCIAFEEKENEQGHFQPYCDMYGIFLKRLDNPCNKEKIINISEKSLGDVIEESFRQLTRKPKDSDDKPVLRHCCNICGYPFSDSELIDDPDIGFICGDCNDNMKELEQEQEDLATLIREEKNSKAGV